MSAKRTRKRSRYFTHKDGFGDGGIMIEVRGRLAWYHINGKRKPGFGGKLYPLSFCLQAVKNGTWKELPKPSPRKKVKRGK